MEAGLGNLVFIIYLFQTEGNGLIVVYKAVRQTNMCFVVFAGRNILIVHVLIGFVIQF